MVEYAVIMIFPAAMAFAAATDLLTMTIPNRVSLVLLAAFFLAAILAGFTWQEMLSHMAAGSILLLVGIFLFSMGFLGGGDAKLLAVASLWFGFEQLLPFLVCVSVFGGALAMAVLAYRSMPAEALPLPNWAARLHTKGEGMPYGMAIAAGALAIFPTTAWIAALAA